MKDCTGLNRSARTEGFTLLELLVILGIITVLLGILIPVINRAQSASRSVSCISTLHSIGAAFKLYATDNRMSFPDPGTVGLSWEQLLAPYHKADFKCPSDDEIFPTVGSSYDWRDTPEAGTTLAGISLAAIKRSDVVLAFEALSGWHKKQMINVVAVDGSARTMEDAACFTDLDTPLDPHFTAASRRRPR